MEPFMSDIPAAAHQVSNPSPPQPNDEDRRAITDFFDRLRAVDLPRDPGAEALIADLIGREPKLRYVLTQLAFFQEHALAAAQNRIQDLEYQLEQKQGGLFGSLFGSRTAPPPRPVQAPGAVPGQFSPSRGGFLGGAGGLAVGVLGGALLGAAVMSALTDEPAAAAPAYTPADDDDDDSSDFDSDY
jgi:hypothetical protein